MECFHLLYLLSASPLTAPAFLSYISSTPLLFFSLLAALPPASAASASPTTLLQQRRFLLSACAQQLFRSSSPALLHRLQRHEDDGSLFVLSLLPALRTELPPTPSLPQYVNGQALSLSKQHDGQHFSYHLPRLFLLLTQQAGLTAQEAASLCEAARQWNVVSERVGAVVDAGDAWCALLSLLAPHLSSADVAFAVSLLLTAMVSEDAACLSLSASLSCLLLLLAPHCPPSALLSSHVTDRLMDALVNHQQPSTRSNLYALLLLCLQSLPAQQQRERERLLAALVAQGGRVLGLVVADASEGGLVMKAVTCSLLSAVVAASPATTLPLLRESSLLPACLSQLQKREEELRLCLVSARSAHLQALQQYHASMRLLTQLAAVRGGRELLVDSGALTQLTGLKLWSALSELEPLPAPSAQRFCLALLPLLQLMVAMLSSPHAAVLAAVLSFLRQHAELVTALLRCRRDSGVAALQAMLSLCQLMERAETAARDCRRKGRVVTDAALTVSSSTRETQRESNALLPLSGVSGHLRGLLKYVGVALPAVSAVPPPTLSSAVAAYSVSVQLPSGDEAAALDSSFLSRYDKLLLLQLQSCSQLPPLPELLTDGVVNGSAGDAVESGGELERLQEAVCCAIVRLLCVKLDFGRSSTGETLLFGSGLEQRESARQRDATSPPQLGLLLQLIQAALERIEHGRGEQRGNDADEAVEAEEAEREQQSLVLVEQSLWLLWHHAHVFERGDGRKQTGRGGGDAGEQWRDRARPVILPVLDDVDRLLSDGGAAAGVLKEEGMGDISSGGSSTALVPFVAQAGSSGGLRRSLFVSAFSRKLRKLLM